jgi:PAS domain S-box-containing protein/putative nucleotidyltransferase with HDIG domain
MKLPKIRVDIRVALLYAIFGGAWVLFSDSVLANLVLDPKLYMRMQTYKGWFFVSASAVLIFFLLLREINQQKRTDAELLRTESLYRNLFEHMAEGFAYCKMVFEHGQPTDWVYLVVNKAFEKLTGLKDITGKQVSEAIPGIRQSDPGLFEIYGRVAETGKAEQFEIFLEALKEWFFVSVYSPQKEYFVAVFSVITERKQAEEALRKSQDQLLLLIQQAPLSIAMFDREMRYIAASQRWVAEYGQGEEKLAGRSHYELNPNLPERWKEAHRKGLEGEFLNNGNDLWVHEDGTKEWLRWAIVPWRDAEDRIGGIILSVEDITVRKRAEETIHRRADELSALQAIILDVTSPRPLNETLEAIVEGAVALLDATSGGLYLSEPENRRVRCVVSYKTPNDYTGTTLEYGEGAAGQVAQTGEPLLIDDYRTWPGRAALYEKDQPFQAVVSVPLLWRGKVIGVTHVIRERKFSREDLGLLALFANHAAIAVERVRLLDKIQENEERYRLLFENAPMGILSIDPQGQILEVNPSALQILGSPSAEMTKKINILTFPPLMEAGISADLKRCLDTRQPIVADHFYTSKWGKSTYVHYQMVPIFDEQNQIGQVQFLIDDITERKQAEEALIASEKRFKALIENGVDLIVVIDGNGIVQFASPSIERILGYLPEEVIGRNCIEWVRPDELPLAQEALASRRSDPGTTSMRMKAHGRHKDGSWRAVEAIGSNLLDEPSVQGIVLNIRDVSVQEQAEMMQDAVYRISEAAQKVTSQEELFREVHAIIGKVMPANNFYIALYDEAKGLLRYPYYIDEQDGLNPFPDGPVSKGMTEYVMRTGKSLLCGLDLFAELVERGEVELVGTPSLIWLGVPLTIGNRTIGIMALQDYTNAQAYREREQRMLEYVSGQIARVIERQQGEEALREKEERYRGLFEDSPISLWEEDFSEVKKRLDALRQMGITDFPAHLEAHPEEVAECASLVRIVDVNKATLKLYHAGGKEELLRNLMQIFREESFQQFQTELINIAGGRTHFDWEGTNQTVDHERIDVNLSWTVAPGCEEDLSRVIVSIVDITERKQAEVTVLARKKELEALFSLSTRLSTPLREEEILPIVLEEIRTVLETDGGAVILLDEGSRQFVTVSADGPLAPTIGYRHNANEGAAGQVFETRKPLLVENYATYDQRVINAPEADKLGLAIFAPIQSEDQFLGVLLATHLAGKQAPSFSEDALQLLSAMGQMVGNALRRARLYQQALGRLNHLQGMQNINTVIANSLDLDLSLGVLVKEVRSQMEADAAAAFILDPHSMTLNFVTGDGLRTRILSETRPHLGEACAGMAALEQRLIGIPNTSAVREEISKRIFEREGIASSYAFPMLAKGKVRGVLQIFHRSPYNLDTEREELLKTLASQAALAVDNIQLFDDLQQSNFRLAMAYDATIEGWSNALDLRDKETEGHTQRVTDLTLELARVMGITGPEMVHIRRGALLHDIGKMGVPDHILLKPASLTPDEWAEMRRHPVHAYKMLSPIQFLHPALDIPHHHHERWDGSGYPDGLKGERIPLHARLFTVVDVWDAITSDRPYRKAWTRKQALDYIREQSGKLFDPQVVDEFLRMIQPDKAWDRQA